MALSGLVLLSAGLSAANAIDVHRFKPVWWLGGELGDRRFEVREKAYRSLRPLLDQPDCPRAALEAVGKRLVDIHRDEKNVFTDEQELLVVRLRQSGLVGDEDWQRFLEQMVDQYPIRLRSQVRRKEVTPVAIFHQARPLVEYNPANFQAKTLVAYFDVHMLPRDSAPPVRDQELTPRSGNADASLRWVFSGSSTTSAPVHWDKLEPTSVACRAWIRVVFFDEAPLNGSPLGTVIREYPFPISVAEEGKAIVTPVSRPDLAALLSERLSVAVEKRAGYGDGIAGVSPTVARVSPTVLVEGTLPVPLSFDVWVRCSGKEKYAGRFTAAEHPQRSLGIQFSSLLAGSALMHQASWVTDPDPSKCQRLWIFDGIPLSELSERVDIVMRPNAQGAEATIDLVNYADCDLVFKDVEVGTRSRYLRPR